jgi:hypothetical protein
VRLLGVLLAIGIALGLTAYVADRVGSEQRAALPTVPTEPGAVADPAQPAIPAARAAACAAERQVVAAAEEAYRAVQGRYADLPTVLAAGYLRALPAAVTVTVADDGGSYAVGGC